MNIQWGTTGIGIISVVETNQYGCSGDTVYKQVNIGVSCDSLSLTLTPHALACHGNCNGFITANPEGGHPPYTYQWNDAYTQIGPTAFSLCAGTYSVTVMDHYNCAVTETATITEPAGLTINVTVTDATCTVDDGTATSNASGGAQPYTFVWSNGAQGAFADSLSAGTYLVSVTDNNNCSTFALVTINDALAPNISVSNITNVSCHGGADGTVDMNVTGGVQPYHFLWSNGAATEDISSGLSAGPYELEVTDTAGCKSAISIILNEPQQLNIQFTVTNASCGAGDGTAAATVTGGTQPYTYIWSNDSTSSNIQHLTSNIYTLTVTDSHSCTATGTVGINSAGGPVVTLDSTASTGCGASAGGVFVHATGGAQPYSYLWSNNAVTQNIANVPPGNYSLTVSDANGCEGTFNAGVAQVLPQVQPICMVTVDSVSNKNLVVWERVQTTGIDYYKIYKEGSHANLYQYAGIVDADSLSVWKDPVSNSFIRSWRYKISAVDSCGNESQISPVHKTIHLNQNQGTGNFVNLIWDFYEGYNYDQFLIYRWRPSTGVELIDSLPGNLTSYTDNNVPSGLKRYFIAALRLDGDCAPAGSKDMSGPFSQSLSNIEDNGIIDVNVPQTKTGELNCEIYPNPVNNELIIENNTDRETNVELLNIVGQILYCSSIGKQSKINMTTMPSGVYILKIHSEKGTALKKIVKQ
ncbi:MAG: T9SS type A sorting domain-containing protein [Bacteroidia bacterium]|nr:T9SS type A sorting domain-containing protein [Bacteroidia bacterium]